MAGLSGRLKTFLFYLVSIFICVFIITWALSSVKNNYHTSKSNDSDILSSYRTHNEQISVAEATSYLESRDETRDAIFFTETSGTGVVKGRFVCAVESAARAYPNADIYLLIAYFQTLTTQLNQPLNLVLKHHPNVRVLRVDFTKFFDKSSDLWLLYASRKLENSTFKAAHTSDILRMFTVWKYGGAYMDLDIITVRNLTGIHNYLIPELDVPNCYLANGFFAFQKNFSLGPSMFKEMADNFDGTDWYANGPAVWTRAIFKYANVSQVGDLNETNLRDFSKLEYRDLFPVDYDKLDWYFDEKFTHKVLQVIKDRKSIFGIHIGNNIAHNNKVSVGSHQAYSFLAQTYCPRAYWSCYDQF